MGLHRRRVWELAKGFRGRARNCIKIARQQAEKALQHAYKGRHDKRGDKRSLWIARINAAARQHGMSYSHFVNGLRTENVTLNRKMLSELAIFEPHSFKALVEQVQFMRGPALPPRSQGSSGCPEWRAAVQARLSVGELPAKLAPTTADTTSSSSSSSQASSSQASSSQASSSHASSSSRASSNSSSRAGLS